MHQIPSKAHLVLLLTLVLILPLLSCQSAPAPKGKDVVSGASPAGNEMPAIKDEIAPLASGKRVLVVFFSQGSATRRVADDLASLLGADSDPIIELKSRQGFFGFISAGADSSMGKATPIAPALRDPSAYDFVVVCTPVWAWHLAPPVRSWLSQARGKLPECAYVVVSANTAPEKIVAMMTTASGKEPKVYVGFVEKDFTVESRSTYLAKLEHIVDRLR